jgi:hypothetical protein
MGDVVNLNKFRKQQQKVAKTKRAETNRRLHGRTKLERARDQLQKQQLTSKLEGAHLQRPQPAPKPDPEQVPGREPLPEPPPDTNLGDD